MDERLFTLETCCGFEYVFLAKIKKSFKDPHVRTNILVYVCFTFKQVHKHTLIVKKRKLSFVYMRVYLFHPMSPTNHKNCMNINTLAFHSNSTNLGTNNPHQINVHVEPFSTSVFKDRIWIVATTTKICTRDVFKPSHNNSTITSQSPPTHFNRSKKMATFQQTSLQRHPFSGLLHSAGELLHTPWRIPTSMATVLLSVWSNTFHGIEMSDNLGVLTHASGSAHIASSAYQKWPTKTLCVTNTLIVVQTK